MYTLEEYVDIFITGNTNLGAKLVSRETRLTSQNQPAEVVVLEVMEGALMTVRFTTLYEESAFGATYLIPEGNYEDMLPMIEYSFSTFRVTEFE